MKYIVGMVAESMTCVPSFVKIRTVPAILSFVLISLSIIYARDLCTASF
jgi:hypothetical protein